MRYELQGPNSNWGVLRNLTFLLLLTILSSPSLSFAKGQSDTVQPVDVEQATQLPEGADIPIQPESAQIFSGKSTTICCSVPKLSDLLPLRNAQPLPTCGLVDSSRPQSPTGQGPSAGAEVTEEKTEDEEEDSDRHNFAAAKDGAKIVAANKDAKKPAAVLDSDSDTYLRNECKADKWLAVELSQVAKIDAIELGQYELYSSRVKDFELSVTLSNVRSASKASSEDGTSRILNSPHWQSVANFTAAKLKGPQTFKLKQPTWCKFLLLRWLNQHGTEPVCALNDLRVFGKSAAEDLEDRLARDMGSAELSDVPQSATGTAWAQPPEPGNYGAGSPSAVRLAPSTAEVVDTLSSNESASQEPVSPQPPQTAPPGVQAQPGEGTAKLDEPSAGQAAADSAATVPASQRAVLVEPTTGTAGSAQQDEGLPGNGAGSSKQRNGGSVYDMLVQEIKATKLQQKTLARQLQEVQQDLSASSKQQMLNVGSLREELTEIRQQVMTCAAIEPQSTISNTTDLMHAETTLQLGLLHQDLRSLHAKLNSSQAHESAQKVVLFLVLAILAGTLLLSMQALPHLPWLSRLALMVLAAGNGMTGFWLIRAGQSSALAASIP